MKAHLKVHNVEEISQLYNPVHIGAKENICFICKQAECTGDCERFRTEKEKLKMEKRNERKRKAN